jgi:hypothetical protein
MDSIGFLELAARVLEHERAPMSPDQIWKKAVELNWDKLVSSKGLTPWATLGAQLYVHVNRGKGQFGKQPGRKGKFFLLGGSREPPEPSLAPPAERPPNEAAFYKPFANWLVQMKECTKAIPLGGNRFGGRWGTPDVIGKRESKGSDIIKAPTEIVSAEVKVDSSALITAFGQACSYKLFSHKSYLVVPKNSPQDDMSKLDALCQIFGIGLVLFDIGTAERAGFEIRVRPQRHEPDMFHMNRCMREVESDLFS